jgi:hypothetical protein
VKGLGRNSKRNSKIELVDLKGIRKRVRRIKQHKKGIYKRWKKMKTESEQSRSRRKKRR